MMCLERGLCIVLPHYRRCCGWKEYALRPAPPSLYTRWRCGVCSFNHLMNPDKDDAVIMTFVAPVSYTHLTLPTKRIV